MKFEYSRGDIFSVDNRNITIYECDKFGRLSVPCTLDILQDMGNSQLTQYGFSFEDMKKDNVAFLLSGITLSIKRRPKRDEKIIFKTWAAGTVGAQFERNGVLCSKGNEILMDYSSYWVLVDFEKHKIILPGKYDKFNSVPVFIDYVPSSSARIRIPKLSDENFIFSYRTMYSDIDMNNHLHNTKYFEIIEDVIENLNLSHDYKSVSIAFSGEAKINEEINICYEKSDDSLLITGRHERGRCFEAMVVF